MRILITGATGYVGRNLIPELHKITDDLLIVSRDVAAAETLFPYARHSVAGDWDAVKSFNPEVVLHLATLSTSSDAADIIQPMIEANITFGVQLLAALKECHAMKLFVNIGSFAEYRLDTEKQKDAYLYTATKSAFRHFVDYYADLCNYKYLTLVLYTVYGGIDLRKKIIDYVFDALDAQEPVKMTAGAQCLDFVHVSDVVTAMKQCAVQYEELYEKLPQGTEFHIGSGVGTTIRAMAEMVSEITNKPLNVNWGALPYRPLDVMKAIAPIKNNNALLQWKPTTSLVAGIKEKAHTILGIDF